MKMKSLPKVDLPREKIQKYGTKKLKDYELLAILLGSGIKGLNVLQLSKKILLHVEKIGRDKITLDDLLEIKGLGKAKASQILATFELVNRYSIEQPEILSSEDVWKLCADFRELKREHFIVFYLDSQNRLIERQVISIGTLNASLVHPREVFEPAIRLSACSIIVAHNHPSGKIQPSNEDIDITKRLVQSGKIMGIDLTDHVIITKKDYFSFQKQNML